MKKFFKNLQNKIENAVKKDIKKILEEVGEERIYAVALVTDSDCVTLYLALNTNEYMKRRDEEYVEMLQDDLSEEEIQSVKEGSGSFTKWVPDEWGYADEKNSELSRISKQLFEKEELNSEKYARHIDIFFEAVTAAFKNLINEKVFGEYSEEITYFISMTDDERTLEIENFSAKLLNSEKVYVDFLKRTVL